MKLARILFWNILLLASCGRYNKTNSNAVLNENRVTNELAQEQIKAFEYTAALRGNYQKTTISKEAILTSKKRGGNPVKQPCTLEDWAKLMDLLELIELEQLHKFEPPSKDFQFDGASLARLRIISKDKIYETQGFDHGNPPKEVTDLVKEILSISENIE
ncbi:hypothetical protein [Algibacter mikhailovii]|uniref:Lipoprotein n=1 Tax=Algibacter mikhailovii TaxID=425498 RepID=A0A918R3V0_9FLAO|nr:hypothetical protein [Algibacter mikhailovii]GGZ84824.1 hypothetical protein GCM10007028_23560 [Algibacter mikhailovii]